MRGVADERVAFQVLGKQLFAECNGLGLLHLVEAVRLPHRFGCLDDEGGGVGIELVGMRLEPAMLSLLESKRKSIQLFVRTQPDKTALAQVDIGLVGGGVAGADAAVEAVAGDDQVGVCLLYTSPSPRDRQKSRMPSSA